MQNDDDVARLVGVLVKAAKDLLRKQRGEFYPFAATIDLQGKPALVGAHFGEEQPKATDVVAFLQGALRAQAMQSEIKACGICVNVAAILPGYTTKVDAICCFVDRDGAKPYDIYIPFRKGFLGRFKFDNPVALLGTSDIFRS